MLLADQRSRAPTLAPRAEPLSILRLSTAAVVIPVFLLVVGVRVSATAFLGALLLGFHNPSPSTAGGVVVAAALPSEEGLAAAVAVVVGVVVGRGSNRVGQRRGLFVGFRGNLREE